MAKRVPPNKGKYKRPVIDGKKECRTCERMLPLSKYSKGPGAGGLQPRCKDCVSEYYKGYQERQRKINREYEARGEYRVKEKQCSWCRGTFAAEAFSRDVSRPDGLQWACKDCSCTWHDYYYYKPKPKKVTWEDVEAKRNRVEKVADSESPS